MECRLLMCRTHPVLAFDADPRTHEAVGSGEVLDRERLPRELITHGKDAVYASRINGWWHHRAIPSTRDNIGKTLRLLGMHSTVDMLNRSLGLSLSDQFWVKPADSTVRWEDINFFDNPFDEGLGKLLLTPVSSTHGFSFAVPDSSTGGDLPKRWFIGASGARNLVKKGRTGQEPFNEVIAMRLCQRLGIETVTYRLGVEDNQPVCICPDMLTNQEELVSAWQLLGSVKRNNRLSAYNQWIEAAVTFGCDRDAIIRATDSWLLVDYLMRNTDRHYNNFGLIRNVETLMVRPAPMFDTGTSLWAGQVEINNLDYMARPFYSAPKSPSALRQLRLIQSWDAFNLATLSDWPDEVANHLSKNHWLTDTRVEKIHTMLSHRVETVLIQRNAAVISMLTVPELSTPKLHATYN